MRSREHTSLLFFFACFLILSAYLVGAIDRKLNGPPQTVLHIHL